MALRARFLLKNLVPAVQRVSLSTSPVVRSGGVAQLSKDASGFGQLMRRDGFSVVALLSSIAGWLYIRYSVSYRAEDRKAVQPLCWHSSC